MLKERITMLEGMSASSLENDSVSSIKEDLKESEQKIKTLTDEKKSLKKIIRSLETERSELLKSHSDLQKKLQQQTEKIAALYEEKTTV
jgi:chromosome segregation ATPase